MHALVDTARLLMRIGPLVLVDDTFAHHQAQWHRPEGYLRYVLEHIVEHPINKIDQLLLWRLGSGLAGSKPAA
jgi:hypothetical protein